MISEDKIKYSFSANLRRLMKEKKITEIILASETEISQSAVNRIKNGQVCASLHHSVLIATALKVSIDELISEPKENTNNIIGYIPILNSRDLMLNKEKNVVGFYNNDTVADESVLGFKYDKSFASKALNKESIVIVRLSKKFPSNGSILFVKNNEFIIGSIQNKVIRSLDNLEQAFKAEEVDIIGQILKIETTYIKEPSTIKILLSTLGEDFISKILDQLTTNVTSFA